QIRQVESAATSRVMVMAPRRTTLEPAMTGQAPSASDPAQPPRIITSDQFHSALVAAGAIPATDSYRRIVIDAQYRQPVVMYADRFGDERLLQVATTLDGIQVTTGQPAAPDQPLPLDVGGAADVPQ